MINLRDWGSNIWEKSNKPTRVLIALGGIGEIGRAHV